MKILDCKTNHFINPIGYELRNLRVSWKVEEAKGKHALWSRVTVACDAGFSDLVFDTGACRLNSLATPLAIDLKPYTRYYWQVEVATDAGERAVSEIQFFETGKLKDDWSAKWIGCGDLETQNPVFEKTITLSECVPDARLYICGLGVYEAYINGERIGNEYLAPGCHDYNMWLQYQTYEVCLKKGENILRVSLGNGWYKGRFGMFSPTGFYGKEFSLIAEIRKQGKLIAETDKDWEVYGGDILENGLYDGESYAPSTGKKDRTAVNVLDKPKELLHERLSLPVVVKEKRKPIELIHTPAGEFVLDMGQNYAGIFEMKVAVPTGKRVHLQFGEVLQDGNFYNDNLRSAKAEYWYTSDGKEHILRPAFTYYGYRYVKVEGLPELKTEDFTGLVLYSDLQETGSIITSNEKINRLIQNIFWGQRSNYVDIPTDCPQRDERLGWTADAQVFSRTACYNMDSYAFLNKYMYDIRMTILEKGKMTGIIPAFDSEEATSCAWGDAATIIPWNLYQFYGDETILREQYESMKFWVDYMRSQDNGEYLWVTDQGFGDWLAKDHDNPAERYAGGTELAYLATAYYYYSTDIVAKSASILGMESDAAEYSALAEKVRSAFINEYFTPSGRLAVNTQTAYVVALFMGLAPDDALSKTADALAQKLSNSGNYLKTGFVGTPLICPVLSAYGHSGQAYQLLFNEGVPSWLYAVNLGATTVWERWDSMLPDGHVNGTDMNSFNHYSYGSILEWMYSNMAGLKASREMPGFKKVEIAPEIDTRLKYACASYNSPSGIYKAGWEIHKNGQITVKVTVPFDAQAEIRLPRTKRNAICVESGEYEYTYMPDEPLFKKYNTYDTFLELKNYGPAKPILTKYMPGWENIPDVFCKESLRSLAGSPLCPLPVEVMDLIDTELDQADL